MPIGPLTMFAIYVVCWWLVLFVVLPLGMSQTGQEPPTDGGDWGAPADPQLKKKFITTTWVSAIFWGIVMVIIFTGAIPLPTNFVGPGGAG